MEQDQITNTAPSNSSRQRLIAICLICLVFCGAVGIRLSLAAMAQHPGHADYSYYYTVAENLASGRGFEIDYIWHYLMRSDSITHYCNDYWMPMTSVWISLSMRLFGMSMFAALLPSILAGILLAGVTWLISREYSTSQLVQIGATCLVAFFPPLFRNSLLTDSTIFYALFSSLSLYFMIRSRINPRQLLVAAVCAGVAHLTRQDGVALLVILLWTGWRIPIPVKRRITYLLSAVAVYCLVLIPLWVINWHELGSLFPSGSSKTIFLTQYEDIYSYSRDLTLQQFTQWGWGNIILSKLRGGRLGLVIIYKTLGPILTILAGAAAVRFFYSNKKHRELTRSLPPLLFGGFLFVFYAFVATFPGSAGGFQRSLLAVSPFLMILAMSAIEQFIPTRWLATVVLGIILVYFGSQSYQSSRKFIVSNIILGEQLNVIKRIVDLDCQTRNLTGDVVIMTRNPWQMYHTTRFKAIQIPNEDLETIYSVAKKYGANYLILPAPRAALMPIARGNVQDERFQLIRINTGSWMRLYRIK